jgi:hypothetical protein
MRDHQKFNISDPEKLAEWDEKTFNEADPYKLFVANRMKINDLGNCFNVMDEKVDILNEKTEKILGILQNGLSTKIVMHEQWIKEHDEKSKTKISTWLNPLIAAIFSAIFTVIILYLDHKLKATGP